MPGDQWCLCAARYAQAVQAGKQPKVHLARTHERTLDHVPLEVLLENGVDADAARATLESVDEQRQALEGLFWLAVLKGKPFKAAAAQVNRTNTFVVGWLGV